MIYESEVFDEYLDVNEYIKLREITLKIREIQGKSEQLSQQVEYLERKIYNYSQLYSV